MYDTALNVSVKNNFKSDIREKGISVTRFRTMRTMPLFISVLFSILCQLLLKSPWH